LEEKRIYEECYGDTEENRKKKSLKQYRAAESAARETPPYTAAKSTATGRSERSIREDIQLAKEAALSDGQGMAETLLEAESKLGVLLKPLANPTSSRAGTRQLPEGITKKESHQAQVLAKYPEVVEELKAKARDVIVP